MSPGEEMRDGFLDLGFGNLGLGHSGASGGPFCSYEGFGMGSCVIGNVIF